MSLSLKDRLAAWFRSGATPDLSKLEAMLYEADVPPQSVTDLLAIFEKTDARPAVERLRDAMVERFGRPGETPVENFAKRAFPKAILLVGVNGAGKTTTAAKIAQHWKDRGTPVILAAADTFRAGATEQLAEWGKRLGVEVVTGEPGSDPAAIVYRAWSRARETSALLVADTSGRLQTKLPLMDQLKKIHRMLEKDGDDSARVTLLVLDGTQGQNALTQAAEFSKTVPIEGTVLTKMDGSSKAGFALALNLQEKLRPWFLGIGEKPEDLIEFKVERFVAKLLDL